MTKHILNFSRKRWTSLNSEQKHIRVLSLETLRRMRNGESLTSSIKEIGLSKNQVIKHLGKNIFKRKGRFVASLKDSIQRSMEFYDAKKGRVFVIAKNSKDASKIGKYFSAVRKAIEGNKSDLKKFKGKYFKDANGKKHKFETNIKKIFELEEEIEEPEFRQIYEEE